MSSYAIIEEHLARGRLDPADAMVGLLLEQNADDARAHILLARLLAIRGRTDEGIVRLEQLLGKNPRVPDALAWLAVLWRNKGDKERALLLARRAVALGAKVAECEIMLGDDALARGDVVEASSFFDRATSRGGGRLARAWLGKGKVQRRREQLADAEESFARAVELDPKDLEGWLELIHTEIEGGANDAADDNIALALRQHPSSPALLTLKTERDQQRHRQDPLEQALQEIRAALYAGAGDEAATQLQVLAPRYRQDPRITFVEGELAAVTGKGDVVLLVNELTRLCRERPTDWQPRAALGRLLLRTSPVQNIRAGLAHCEEAWRMSAEHPRAGLFLFETYAVLGKKAFAVALGKKVAATDSPEAGLARQLLTSMGEKI